MSKQQRYLSQAMQMAVASQTAPNRPVCDEHGKVLYTSRHDALEAQVGAMASRRIRTYPCEEHPDRLHVTKEDVRYREQADAAPNRRRKM